MPSEQRGSVERLNSGWAARWRDENGRRCQQGGLATRSEAHRWLHGTVGEVAALRRGDPSALRRRTMPTLREHATGYLAAYTGERNSKRTLEARLGYALAAFGDTPLDRLDAVLLAAWRGRLPERSAHAIVKALRQVLNHAVRVGIIAASPAASVSNPEPKRREVPSFGSLAELEAVAAELPDAYAPLPIFAALTGLRPSEWIAVERGDLDRAAGVVHVRRVYTDGTLKPYGKTSGSLRTVPLPLRAADALQALPPRIDTPLLFPGERGAHLHLHTFRRDHWNPALDGAGLPHRTPYSTRHTFAAFSIAAGVSLFELARFMGTSVEQIGETYGHLLPDALDRARGALDAFMAGNDAAVDTGTR
jgi:integrase